MPRPKREIISASLYQRKPKNYDPDKAYTIELYCSLNRQLISQSTGLKVKPSDWDEASRLLYPHADPQGINCILTKSLDKINEELSRLANSGQTLDKILVKKIFKNLGTTKELKRLATTKKATDKISSIPENYKSQTPDDIPAEPYLDNPPKDDLTEDSSKNSSDNNPQNINEKFRLDFTIQDTGQYCKEMLQFVGKFPDRDIAAAEVEGYMRKAHKINVEYGPLDSLPKEEKVEKQSRLNELFNKYMALYAPLKTFLRKEGGLLQFRAFHLTKRLAVERDQKRGVNYEFLVEYNIFEPHVEIYYGIKAVSDNSVSTEAFVEREARLATKFFNYIQARNGTSSGRKEEWNLYSKRLKLTNNANDGTFWIIWARKEGAESLTTTIFDLEFRLFTHFNDFYRTHGHAQLEELSNDFSETRVFLNRQEGLSPLTNLMDYIREKPNKKNYRKVIPEDRENNKKKENHEERKKEKEKERKKWRDFINTIKNRINILCEEGLLLPYKVEGETMEGEFVVNLPHGEDAMLIEVITNKNNWIARKEDDITEKDRRVYLPDRYMVDLFHPQTGGRWTEREFRDLTKPLKPSDICQFIEEHNLSDL
ncbi:MAG: hypothetical protein J1D77_02525 [Muribaculaceae bacterium]|nr:hypothetical protein [Muribaculaceae bacterium]